MLHEKSEQKLQFWSEKKSSNCVDFLQLQRVTFSTKKLYGQIRKKSICGRKLWHVRIGNMLWSNFSVLRILAWILRDANYKPVYWHPLRVWTLEFVYFRTNFHIFRIKQEKNCRNFATTKIIRYKHGARLWKKIVWEVHKMDGLSSTIIINLYCDVNEMQPNRSK